MSGHIYKCEMYVLNVSVVNYNVCMQVYEWSYI